MTIHSISIKQNQYLAYILSDTEALSRLEVVPERGGMITQWKIQGQDILYLDQGRFSNPALSVRGGIPILFPICGNLPNDQYHYDNQSYSLKQHGFARDLPWSIVGQDTENGASLSLSLRSSEQTKQVYPFDFELRFTYLLRGNSLRIQQQFQNHSAVAMPFSIGLHPYFQVSNKAQLSFDIPSNTLQNQKDQTTSAFSGNFDFETSEIDVAFTQLSQSVASFTDLQKSLQIKITYDDLYANLVFWTLKEKEFICLEPWSAPRNALNNQINLTYIQPGKILESSVEFMVSYLT